MRPLLITLNVLVLLALITWSMLSRITFTPEQGLQRLHPVDCPPETENTNCLKPLKSRIIAPRRAVVVYRRLQYIKGQTRKRFGYIIINWQERTGWASFSGAEGLLIPSPEDLIEYKYHIFKAVAYKSGGYSMIYGRVLKPVKVAVVEATFCNGQTLRNKITDGDFAMISKVVDDVRICNLRVLGAGDQVLEYIDLT